MLVHLLLMIILILRTLRVVQLMIIFKLSLARMVLLMRLVFSLFVRLVIVWILVLLIVSRVRIRMSLWWRIFRWWSHLITSLTLILRRRWMVVIIVVIVTTKLIIPILVKEVAIWVHKTSILIDIETLFIVLTLFIAVGVGTLCLDEWTGASLWNNSSFNLSNSRLLFGGTLHFLLFCGLLIPVSFFVLNFPSRVSHLLAFVNLLRV